MTKIMFNSFIFLNFWILFVVFNTFVLKHFFKRSPAGSHDNEEKFVFIPTKLKSFDFDRTIGVFDKHRSFKIHMFSSVGDSWSNLSLSSALCLGTQSSVDRLDNLVEIAASWSGPISVAVFAPSVELSLGLRYIQFLKQCFPKIQRQVVFHLIYPVEYHGEFGLNNINKRLMNCLEPKQELEALMRLRPSKMLQWREEYPYPQNLLRNLAKAGCQTNFTFIPDIDMVPSQDMNLQMETFLTEHKCEKCAFVIPTYEISRKAQHLPANKTDLLTFIKEKNARQFHQKLYSVNQKSSNLNRWEKIHQAEKMEIAYKVEKYLFKYEPIYISKSDTPQYDERFVGFGLTRNTQV